MWVPEEKLVILSVGSLDHRFSDVWVYNILNDPSERSHVSLNFYCYYRISPPRRGLLYSLAFKNGPTVVNDWIAPSERTQTLCTFNVEPATQCTTHDIVISISKSYVPSIVGLHPSFGGTIPPFDPSTNVLYRVRIENSGNALRVPNWRWRGIHGGTRCRAVVK